MADAYLKRIVREALEEQMRRAQPRAMTVGGYSGEGDDVYMLNPIGDESGTGWVERPVRWTGPFELTAGDKVLVSGIGNNLTILAHTYNADDSTPYPRLRADQVRAPSGELYLYADSGYGLVLNATEGKVVDEFGVDVIDFLTQVSGPASSTDNAIARFNGVGGATLQDSGVLIDDDDRLTLPNSATTPPLNVTERSAAPSSPGAGDIYLDDGTNTGSGNPGWRRYTGAAWEDVSAAAGGGGTDADAIHDNVAAEISAITQKYYLLPSDWFVVESDADSDAKRAGQLFYIPQQSLLVLNSSGDTAAYGDVGFLQAVSGGTLEYVTTTTAGDWQGTGPCVVLEGGADNAAIVVTQHGLVQVNYAGGAPSAGDYLITSTTAGSAAGQTYPSPAIFAKCAGNGAGGVVGAQLLCNRVRRPLTLDNDILRINSTGNFSGAGWSGGVNDAAPTSSPITVSTSTGALADITPVSSSEHGHIVIRNTTRSNEALIASISGSDITFVSDTPLATWQNGDALTAVSNVMTGAGDVRAIDLSQSADIPELAVEMGVTIVWRDTGAAGKDWTLHPYEVVSGSNIIFTSTQVLNVFIRSFSSVPIAQRRFGVSNSSSGSGTGLGIIRIQYIIVAAP